MGLYAKLDPQGNVVEYPLTGAEIRERHRNVSFPSGDYSAYGYVPVLDTPAPAGDGYYEVVNELEPVRPFPGGPLSRRYEVVTMVGSERVQRAAELAAEMRRRRDAALRASDWTQLPDAPLTPAQVQQWRAYRAQLRALLQGQADPASVVLPEPPM